MLQLKLGGEVLGKDDEGYSIYSLDYASGNVAGNNDYRRRYVPWSSKGIVIMAAWGTPSMFLISCGELFNMVMSRSILMKRIVFIVWINLQDGELMPIMN